MPAAASQLRNLIKSPRFAKQGVANLSDVLNLRTLGVHAPEPDTAVSSGDCDQTWREREQAGALHLGSSKGSAKSQARALENKV